MAGDGLPHSGSGGPRSRRIQVSHVLLHKSRLARLLTEAASYESGEEPNTCRDARRLQWVAPN
jgi:hypothetical protein